jgi:DNA-binding winged helix-turn-helix (wHTH) protein
VAGKLEQVTGRPVTRHNVTQIISRLRERLERGGVNRFVVATCRDRGVRFLLDEGPLGRVAKVEARTLEASGSDGGGSSS